MATLIKKTNNVTITDITEEAKEILKSASSGFATEEYKKQAYLKQFNLSDVVWLKTYGNGLVRSNNNLESVQI